MHIKRPAKVHMKGGGRLGEDLCIITDPGQTFKREIYFCIIFPRIN